MKLVFPNTNETALFLLRRAGYGFERKDPDTGEDSFGRRLSAGQFPKFHIYAHKEGDTLFVNLHLDQKKPTYEGSTAHSGEYDGGVVEQEAERIKFMIKKANKDLEKQFIAGEKTSFFGKMFSFLYRHRTLR